MCCGVIFIYYLCNEAYSRRYYNVIVVCRVFTAKFKTTVTFQLAAGTTCLTAKCYKVFPTWVKQRSIKIIKSTYLYCSRSFREMRSDNRVQLYQWTPCIIGDGSYLETESFTRYMPRVIICDIKLMMVNCTNILICKQFCVKSNYQTFRSKTGREGATCQTSA